MQFELALFPRLQSLSVNVHIPKYQYRTLAVQCSALERLRKWYRSHHGIVKKLWLGALNMQQGGESEFREISHQSLLSL